MLLVEDDETIRSVLKVLLEPFFEVQEAIDGAGAAHWFTKRHFDVVFVDYMLPDTNGVDVLRRLRATDPAVRRVITSGWLLPDLFSLASGGLIHSFVLKPAPIEEIVRACSGTAARTQRLTL
jgi:DNA-binding NarL/FixJ family response regulator